MEPSEHSPVLDNGQPKMGLSFFVIMVAAMSAVGGLLFGYDTGVVSGAMLLMRDRFSLDSTMQGVVVSVTILTAWIFCLGAGQAADRFGRKKVIITGSIVFTAGSLVMGSSQNIEMLLAGRVIVGMGIGLASMCVPMYIAEVAPSESRGLLVTINSCAITSGQLLASIVDGLFSHDHVNGWRYMLGIAAVPAVIQFVAFMFMPESPRWLVAKGRYEEAVAVLRRVRTVDDDIQEEFRAIQDDCNQNQLANNGWLAVLKKICGNSALRMALLVGCMLQVIQQLAGINTVMYYSASIIEMSGVRDKSKVIWLSAATSGMNAVCSIVGLFFVERVGRRKLTLYSLFGVAACLYLLGASFYLAERDAPPVSFHDPSANGTSCFTLDSCSACVRSTSCGFCFLEEGNRNYNGTCLPVSPQTTDMSVAGACNTTEMQPHITWAYNWCPSMYSWMTFGGLLMYLFFFAPGMGSMPWTINSEIYPLWARGTCYSIATSMNWLFNFVVSLTFLDLMQLLTKHGAFYFYGALASLGFVFLFCYLPETKNVSLEHVEELFEVPWWKDRTTSSEKKTLQSQLEVGNSTTANIEDLKLSSISKNGAITKNGF